MVLTNGIHLLESRFLRLINKEENKYKGEQVQSAVPYII